MDRVTGSEKPKPPSKAVRININLSEKNYDELKALAADRGMDMSEFVRNAIRTYNTLLREMAAGKEIYIGTEEKVEKELLIPL
ncbi:MAG TPA: ribbon-helix-helix domain-containing protein [Chthonomonadaceae bacterium]|nr:ribbon-helix-helix domain-containing protein [Chthonomonadaceae bacterium]